MSTGELSWGGKDQAVAQELGIGFLTGSVFGVTCGFVVYLLNYFGIQSLGSDPFMLGVTISCGILGACLTATCLGTFSPFFFVRFGIDPAVASGPIVTAFNDVLSTLMFFLIARIVYSVFLWG